MVASITLAEGEPTEPKHGDVNDTAGGSPDLTDWAADNVTTGTFGSVTVASSQSVPVPVETSKNFTVEVPPVANLTGRKPLDGGLTTQMLDSTNATVAPPRVIIGVVSTTTANSTVPLMLPGSPESGSGVHIAVAIVPVLIAFSIILALLIVFLSRKKRFRVLTSKGRAGRDEENSMEVTSMLMNHDHGDDDDTLATAVYAIVNKTKKAKNDSTSTAGIWAPSVTGSAADRHSSAMTSAESGNLITNIPDIDIPTITLLTPNGEQHFLLLDNMHSTQLEQKPRCDMPVRKEGEEEEEKKEEEGKEEENIEAGQPEPVVRVTDSVIVDPTVRTSVEPRGLVELGVAVADADMTLVECDVYEPAGHYDPNRDDEDGTYEIPDSPATVRARNSVVGLGALLQSRDHQAGGSPTSTTGGVTVATDIAMPQRVGADTSDSDSEHESDFEDLWGNHTDGDSNGGKVDDSPNNRRAPPVPKLLPLDDLDTEYLFPKCHKHCPPGPDWKPFHEYDPVYVPHSDPAGMADRLDNQNYVRGRQRTDSHQTNAYEEIQFGGQIYDTVDDDDDIGDNDDGVNNNSNNGSENGPPRNPLQLPPRAPRPPSPPPPLVPRRTRPISGFADIGHRASTLNKPLPPKPKPESERESCYSGLIMDDVSDPEDGPNHEYTALAYTKLRSVGSGPLLDGQDDDFRAIDETDSETYAKQPLKAPVSSPHLTPRTTSDTSNDVSSKPATENIDSSNKTSVLFFNGNSEIFSNGHMVAQDESDSTDSDDSYEAFDFDILPPDSMKKTTEKHQ